MVEEICKAILLTIGIILLMMSPLLVASTQW